MRQSPVKAVPVSSASTSGETRSAGAPPQTRLGFRLFVVSAIIATLPVVVATTRAIRRGWVPLSDDAFFSIRARDVFSYHHFSLVGLVSSASLTVTDVLHHPGPLQFELLAPFVRLFGGSAGLAIGVGLLNVAAIGGIAWFAYRRGGAVLGAMVMLATAALCWAMTSDALFEPWQPYGMLLPFFCFTVLCWSVACGDLVALPLAAGVASLVLQSHLSYAVLVPTMTVAALVGLGLELRGARRTDAVAWPRLRRRARRAAATAGVVVGACWVPPLIDQFAGQGNLGRLLGSAGPPNRIVGYGLGTRLVASVVTLPPWWFPSSMQHTLLPSTGWRPPSLVLAIASLLALAAVFAGGAMLARRSGDRVALWGIVIATSGIVAALATAGRVPVTAFGLEAHVYRWLWPLGALVFTAVAATLARRLVPARIPGAKLIGLLTLATIVVAALNVPRSLPVLSPNAREDAIPAARAIDRQMGRLDGKGPILVDQLLFGRLADPYGTAFIAELQRRGISFVAKDPVLAGQLGPARRYTGANARSALFFTVGRDRLKAPPGTPRVAHYDGLTAREQRERAGLMTQLNAYLSVGETRLNDRGRRALQGGALPTLAAQLSSRVIDAEQLLASGDLTSAFHQGFLRLDRRWTRPIERLTQLDERWDTHTVSLFLAPLGPRRQPRRS